MAVWQVSTPVKMSLPPPSTPPYNTAVNTLHSRLETPDRQSLILPEDSLDFKTNLGSNICCYLSHCTCTHVLWMVKKITIVGVSFLEFEKLQQMILILPIVKLQLLGMGGLQYKNVNLNKNISYCK